MKTKTKIKERRRFFTEQVKKNRDFYERAKEWITEQYAGRYVVIADGEVKDARDCYDKAIERSLELEKVFLTVLVFKAGEEPFFGTEAHGLGASQGPGRAENGMEPKP